MTIYSWNMLYRNHELDRAFEFISHTRFDIFCLQEVPEAFLERLKSLPYSIAFRTDVSRLLPTGTTHNYIVTLSRHPLESQKGIPFKDYWKLLPWRTRFFVRIMPSRYFSKIRGREGLVVDAATQNGIVRIFNLHLVLAHPALRLEEFEQAMAERDPSLPTIVCGDFNILEARHITPLNWILGGTMSDVFFSKQERTHIEKRFVEHNMTNALYGSITHPVSRSQLDHILVSHSFSITNAEVLPDRVGSDHHPIRVVLK